jgi:predicted chitinase
MGGSKGLVLAALVAAGYSTAAQANIMANVDKESGFNPRSEELERYTGKNLFNLYGGPEVGKNKSGQPLNAKNNVVRFNSLKEAEQLVKQGPKAVGDIIYGGRMGNTEPGDGYKYRGRGFIQITGKDMYNRVGKLIGVDLVNNPDLANQPETAAKIIPAFFKLKAMEKKLKPEEYDDINVVNKAVGSADVKSRELRVQLSKSYSDQLNSMSSENADMKKDMSQGSAGGSPVIIQNNNTTQAKTNIHRAAPKEELNPTMR